MASRVRLLGCADIVNRSNGLLSFRITKVVNNGRNLSHSEANYSPATEPLPEESEVEPENQSRINRAVTNYLQQTKEYEKFIKEQKEEFEKGKKFLARIMGKDSDSFSQQEIDEAIEYLFPSGLFKPIARPMMKPPELLFAKRKEAQFDRTGRPHHFLFYTAKPNFYQVLHDCSEHLHNLNEKLRNMGPLAVHPTVPLNVVGTSLLKKPELEKMLLENLLDSEYEKFVEAIERLSAHPYAFEVASFIMQFRQMESEKIIDFPVPTPVKISDNVFLVEVDGCRRKKCKGNVKLIKPGAGKLNINGKSLIDFFEEVYPRQEVIFPLIFTDMLDKVDVEATVDGEGISNQAFTVRYGISVGLTPFLTEEMIFKMKLAGLLQRDPRVRERDKPGQRGARRKYTWLKR